MYDHLGSMHLRRLAVWPPMRFSCQVSSWPVHPDRSTHPPVARADS